jgi:hypothetical protein
MMSDEWRSGVPNEKISQVSLDALARDVSRISRSIAAARTIKNFAGGAS